MSDSDTPTGTPAGADLTDTPLTGLHRALGGRLVPFAGYAMPLQYDDGPVRGILAEHHHTRTAAGLFDVSHMGQAILTGRGVAGWLERLVPADLSELRAGRMRYTQLTTEDGGIRDDLMVARPTPHALDDWGDDALFLVVNAATKEDDFAHIAGALAGQAQLTPLPARALIALQGPQAAAVLARIAPAVAEMRFMEWRALALDGIGAWISRSGYTGEDGFEISVAADEAETVARRLLAEPEVAPIGLGARDTLRLEAGLCLYGQDIDRTISPVEAGLAWSIGRRRRREGGFPGAERILGELSDGAPRRRIGLLPEGRQPVRAGQTVEAGGQPVGRVTSGGFGPSVGRPVAMALVDAAAARTGTPLSVTGRSRAVDASVADLPFVPPRYHRG